ncbi:unnamed protein product, partial [Mesorhabditis spiculigera]
MESLNSAGSQADNVRTLFVSGLPMDAKPRELYLLFRGYPGYESSLLKMTAKNGKSTSPVGFVTFATRQDADEARKALQGVRFDPECAQTIRLELARSNTKLMALANAQLSAPQHLQMLPMAALQQLAAQQPALLALAQQQQQQAQFAQQLAQHQQYAQTAAAQAALMSQAAAAHTAAAATASTSTAPPCSTLFVANLSAGVNEEELRTLFKSFSGMVRLRLHAKGSSAVAFVEYSDIRSATQAMLNLNGHSVSSNERGSMRIEYARNKMADLS